MTSSDLLQAWKLWRPDHPPYLLAADRYYFDRPRSSLSIVNMSSWTSAFEDPRFGAPGDHRLHLGLIPIPFCGDLDNATVYVLLLNPGLSASDYFGELEVPAYRQALIDNLRQRTTETGVPFFFLDPRFGWHAGFHWWNSKLAGVIELLAQRWEVSFAEARFRLANDLAAVELLPYHSASFRDSDQWLKGLPSVGLARSYVATTVAERVASGAAIAIVTRKAVTWGLTEESDRVVLYTGSEARSAHLSPASRGGKAILKHLTGCP